MFHCDGVLIQYLSKRFGFGVIGSNLTQVNKDRGPLRPVLNGFQGPFLGCRPNGALRDAPYKTDADTPVPLGARIRGKQSIEGQYASVRLDHSAVS